ncbi:hypothetical protein [Nocardia sp. CDC160]|uniref:hypothetical protein n=1 Tax=Nocardia sp. CDC160 TaxID=3112166 RepID=UPI002DBA8BB5|nr:hypothetical protein [Nocardia sp. CDC160]MEC3920371.1 hypothetical protein [Nocardia sp. CDC160]
MELGDAEFHCTAAPLGMSSRYRRDWRHFAIWCAAAEVQALPAAPLTVLEYLADHPGRPATQAGRLAAINSAHRLTGLPVPGRAEALRQALNDARSARAAHWRHLVNQLLPSIPAWGWPGGLVGRRNAAVLVLAASGVSFADIARMTCSDIRINADSVQVGTHPLATIGATGDPGCCPVAVVQAWMDVRPALQRYTGHTLLKAALESGTLAGIPGDIAAADQPLFVMLDQHGYAPMPRIDRSGEAPVLPGLSPGAVAAVVKRHLLGELPKYVIRQHDSLAAPGSRVASDETAYEPPALSRDYYDKGVAARRRDHETLADIPDLLEDAVARMEELLERTSDILRAALDE